ncbi:MAG: amino acid kinase [Candidatus Freyarchaeota archaeon]|nr:amino acid kinase [Candidatus Jordarchaeia archaeon]
MYSAVVKVGGSLARSKSTLKRLCSKLSDLGRRYLLLLVPGGGSFADEVRRAYSRFNLSDDTAHWMALMAMNQFGLMLAELAGVEATETISGDRTVVFLPFKLIFESDPFPHSWDVTSDSVAAYVAWRAGASRVILLKDVDGVFSADPKRHSNARLLKNVKASDLAALDVSTSVDPFLPKLVGKYGVEVWVINGKHPERLEKLLAEGRTLGTKIH